MRRRLAVAFAASSIVALAGAIPTGAVTYGQPDGNGHPYVALVTFLDENQVPLWRCTGTLISPTVVLSAGHCTGAEAATGDVPATAQVFFSPGPMTPGTWQGPGTSCADATGYPCRGDVSGTPVPNPQWPGFLSVPNSHDIGVIVLDTAWYGTEGQFGVLPSPGLLDSLATQRGQQDVGMTVVGYGTQSIRPVYIDYAWRFIGSVKAVQFRSALADGHNVRLSSDPGRDSGGTCFGDSGGPVFLNDTNIVIGVNSFVLNNNCKGSGYAFRTDTSEALDFLSAFLD